MKHCTFIIPVLFHRNDEDAQYDGEATLNVLQEMDAPQDGDIVTLSKCQSCDVEFNLTVKAVVSSSGVQCQVLCEQIELPYKDWSGLKKFSVSNFVRL